MLTNSETVADEMIQSVLLKVKESIDINSKQEDSYEAVASNEKTNQHDIHIEVNNNITNEVKSPFEMDPWHSVSPSVTTIEEVVTKLDIPRELVHESKLEDRIINVHINEVIAEFTSEVEIIDEKSKDSQVETKVQIQETISEVVIEKKVAAVVEIEKVKSEKIAMEFSNEVENVESVAKEEMIEKTYTVTSGVTVLQESNTPSVIYDEAHGQLTPPLTPNTTKAEITIKKITSIFEKRTSSFMDGFRRASLVPPSARRVEDGPPVAVSSIYASVRATNPILDEILHTIQLCNENCPTLYDIDFKDCNMFSLQHATALAAGLSSNTNVKSINLSNTKMQNLAATELAKALKTNTNIETVNLENNQLGPQGIKALAELLAENLSIKELKLTNQKVPAGTDAEQEMVKSLAKNTTLIKLGLSIRDKPSRDQCDRHITRNKEIARKQRLVFQQ